VTLVFRVHKVIPVLEILELAKLAPLVLKDRPAQPERKATQDLAKPVQQGLPEQLELRVTQV